MNFSSLFGTPNSLCSAHFDLLTFQVQLEKEKLGYDLENVQSQLDKALGQASRLQKERESLQLEADRLRDKYDKAQVHAPFS